MDPQQLPPTAQTVIRQFEASAAEYRSSAVHARGADLARLAQLVAERQPRQLLDLGCGAGHAAVAAAPFAATVTAVDLSTAMLQQTGELAAERGLANLTLQQADVAALPFADATFDVVISRFSAHHWPDLPAALCEAARVLKPDGRAFVIDVVGHRRPRADTFLQTIEYLRDPSHVRDYTPAEWQRAAAAAGLQAWLLAEWPLELEFAAWVSRMRTPPALIAVLQGLLADADADLRAAFAVTETSFCIPTALFELRRGADAAEQNGILAP
jgi:ubiquinone/menaquinone biosynthesis C-methylase UbiE